MAEITVYKASAHHGAAVPDVTIRIAAPLPGALSLEGARGLYKRDAKLLALTLASSLPQGTLTQLVAQLLLQTATLYRGPTKHGQED